VVLATTTDEILRALLAPLVLFLVAPPLALVLQFVKWISKPYQAWLDALDGGVRAGYFAWLGACLLATAVALWRLWVRARDEIRKAQAGAEDGIRKAQADAQSDIRNLELDVKRLETENLGLRQRTNGKVWARGKKLYVKYEIAESGLATITRRYEGVRPDAPGFKLQYGLSTERVPNVVIKDVRFTLAEGGANFPEPFDAKKPEHALEYSSVIAFLGCATEPVTVEVVAKVQNAFALTPGDAQTRHYEPLPMGWDRQAWNLGSMAWDHVEIDFLWPAGFNSFNEVLLNEDTPKSKLDLQTAERISATAPTENSIFRKQGARWTVILKDVEPPRRATLAWQV
jgi:hypothetical protein